MSDIGRGCGEGVANLGDLVGLSTTNDLNWCSCGVWGVGGTGDFPLFC